LLRVDGQVHTQREVTAGSAGTPASTVSPALTRRTCAALWLGLALMWFAPLNTPHLFEPDEGRYAEIPREMVASGDWVTPRLDAIKYFEKPALGYWATALAYKTFGQHPWTVRLWPALSGFLGLILTFALGRRLYDQRTALLAVLVQASALLYVAMARIATLDMSLSFGLQIAMTALVLLVRPPPRQQSGSWRLPLLLGVGVALAVMSKGLVGILIPGAVAVLFMLLHRDWRLALRAQPWWTVGALLLLAAPWFALVSARNPEFAHFFFIFQHFQRYLNRADFDRYQPVWFFLPVLALGFLPWTTLLPLAVRRAFRAAHSGERESSLLLIWAAFVLLFFSLSQSKLVPYILPMVPALSLLTGRAVAQLPAARFAAHLRALAAAAAAFAAVLLLLWRAPPMAALVARASTLSIIGFVIAFALLALGAGCGALLCRRGAVLGAAAATAVGGLLLAQSALLAADQLPRMREIVDLTQQLRPWVSAATRMYCVNGYLQPIPFYLQHTCTLVGYRGELDFGLQQEPWRAIADVARFEPEWQQQSDALAILRPEDYQQLEALGAPMRVIYTAPSYVAVLRR
jgi:4-amino-4-deoxy-L-arabinose transferase-like glycosyltransferase